MGQIIKVYNTEANALAGGGTGMISSATIPTSGGNGGSGKVVIRYKFQ